jgi:hypothetical protein
MGMRVAVMTAGWALKQGAVLGELAGAGAVTGDGRPHGRAAGLFSCSTTGSSS